MNIEDLKMSEMNFEQVSILITQRDGGEGFIGAIRDLNAELYSGFDSSIRFARKGRDLVEVATRFVQQRSSPIVDKKFGIIFGVPEGFHERFRGILYAYANPTEAENWSDTVNARNYVTEGHGYYISSMQPDTIVCGLEYKEDRWDKDLFLMLKVFRDPMGR